MNLPQEDKLCFDFAVTLLSDHCDCGENADRRIPCVHYLKACQAMNQPFEDKALPYHKTDTIKKAPETLHFPVRLPYARPDSTIKSPLANAKE